MRLACGGDLNAALWRSTSAAAWLGISGPAINSAWLSAPAEEACAACLWTAIPKHPRQRGWCVCRPEEVSLLEETLTLLQHRAGSSELGASPQPYQACLLQACRAQHLPMCPSRT